MESKSKMRTIRVSEEAINKLREHKEYLRETDDDLMRKILKVKPSQNK